MGFVLFAFGFNQLLHIKDGDKVLFLIVTSQWSIDSKR